MRVVTIDFWNTLVDEANSTQREASRLEFLLTQARTFNPELTLEQCKSGVSAAWAYHEKIWKSEHRTPGARESVEMCWRSLGLPHDAQTLDLLAREFSEGLLKHPPALLYGVAEALQSLSQNHRLGIVSDTGYSEGKVLRAVLKKHGVLDYFSAFSFSNETGVAKPHARAFRHALDVIGAKPEDSIHIGDNERTDIGGAKALGMKTIRYTGNARAKSASDNTDATCADGVARSWVEVFELVKKI